MGQAVSCLAHFAGECGIIARRQRRQNRPLAAFAGLFSGKLVFAPLVAIF
jgi:hypothetical protein